MTDVTVRPPLPRAEPGISLADLRDMLERLRDQTSALWDGQISTNHMLDELRERRPAVPDNTEVNDRLRRIEGLLNSMPRAIPEPSEPESSSTDNSSAVQRLLDRLQDRRQQEPPQIYAPTPTRAPPPSFDAEWAEFLSGAPAVSEQPIQGPPPLVPLVRRTPRVYRAGSVSPPAPSPIPARSRSAPIETVRFEGEPSRRAPRPGRPWPVPRVGQPHRRYAVEPSEPESYLGDIGFDRTRLGPRRPGSPGDHIDFERYVRGRRQAEHPDTAPDGFFDAGRRYRVS